MTDKQVGIAAAAVAAVLAVIIWLLVTGGAPTAGSAQDDRGDVEVAKGPRPPANTTLADVVSASVERRGDDIEFQVHMAQPIPKRLRDEGLDWRWELYEDDVQTWKVFASVDAGANASVLSQDGGYSTSTIDDTLPGELNVEAGSLTVVLDATEIPGLPSEFTWKLTVSLDGSKADPASALAQDMVPDSGFLGFSSDE